MHWVWDEEGRTESWVEQVDGRERGHTEGGKDMGLSSGALGDTSKGHLHGTIYVKILIGKLWIKIKTF